jgi:hypothetical protein
MKFDITHQEEYSRGELLLRTFFGWLYMIIPHFFMIFLYSIALMFLTFFAWWVILFTGETPEWYYNMSVKLNRWSLRLTARTMNLCDGYPSFGLEGADDMTVYEVERVHIGRGNLLIRSFFGFILLIPHIFILYFRLIGTYFLVFFAWWQVLFTGKYSENWHQFNVGTLRWAQRVGLWYSWLIMDYPPFNGQPDNVAEETPIDQV